MRQPEVMQIQEWSREKQTRSPVDLYLLRHDPRANCQSFWGLEADAEATRLPP